MAYEVFLNRLFRKQNNNLSSTWFHYYCKLEYFPLEYLNAKSFVVSMFGMHKKQQVRPIIFVYN